MEEAKLQTLAQIKAFLDGISEVTFRVSKEERNQFIERMTGLSRQQVTRLVWQYRKDGKLTKHRRCITPKNGFTRRYTVVDVVLLAEMDVLHNTLFGLATKKLMERAFQVFSDVRFARQADISVSHLYNLRGNK